MLFGTPQQPVRLAPGYASQPAWRLAGPRLPPCKAAARARHAHLHWVVGVGLLVRVLIINGRQRVQHLRSTAVQYNSGNLIRANTAGASPHCRSTSACPTPFLGDNGAASCSKGCKKMQMCDIVRFCPPSHLQPHLVCLLARIRARLQGSVSVDNCKSARRLPALLQQVGCCCWSAARACLQTTHRTVSHSWCGRQAAGMAHWPTIHCCPHVAPTCLAAQSARAAFQAAAAGGEHFERSQLSFCFSMRPVSRLSVISVVPAHRGERW